MDLRRDALAGAAEIISLAERIAREVGADVVATVGRMEVKPGAVNIIPAEARFTLDLRSPSDAARKAAIQRFEKEAHATAVRRKLTLKAEPIHEIATTPCDAQLQERLAKAVAAVGARAIKLPSGAGHDGLMLSQICPIAMLFVRCKGGVSHNPAEYASPADMGLAIAALVRFIENFSSTTSP
jgi:allantoate deiminase